VLTGSHNWSNSANTKNDENTIIIHNDTIANLFLQYFKASFNSLGGTLTMPPYGCSTTTKASATASVKDNIVIYPNPSYGNISICYQLSSAQSVSIDIYNLTGQKVIALMNNVTQEAGRHISNYAFSTPGIYFVHIIAGGESFTKKVLITE
jgi:hypothetical protein